MTMSTIRMSSLLIALAAAATPFASQAQSTPARAAVVAAASEQQLQVRDPWIRATVAGQKATGAFMVLQPSQPLVLVGARSPLTPVVEVHEMAVVDGVMKMRRIPQLALPAGAATGLKPGGYHIMLMDLQAPVQAGSVIPVTLELRDAQGKALERTLQIPVRPVSYSAGSQQMMHH
ncbi:copper chaperone PCu(A)C [Brachymonas chironomi]|uniref:copper chaperone PCu(A)C n=1 Tax=Brachymonas chironomi TaxID=491919 RepID=UPI00036F359D